uniref:Uncharacterized protein n=1 Tax=Musa acuminata TaxID=4641 RepID=Q1EP92_MUSAC|nr:hypothetical protein MA4_64C22.18 [Musa acuminata]
MTPRNKRSPDGVPPLREFDASERQINIILRKPTIEEEGTLTHTMSEGKLMVNTGIAIDVLFVDAFQKLRLTRSDLRPMTTSLTKFTGRESYVRPENIMLEIGRRAGGLVDVPKDGLRAMSSGIGSEGSGIAQRRSDVAGGQHAKGKDDASEAQAMVLLEPEFLSCQVIVPLRQAIVLPKQEMVLPEPRVVDLHHLKRRSVVKVDSLEGRGIKSGHRLGQPNHDLALREKESRVDVGQNNQTTINQFAFLFILFLAITN